MKSARKLGLAALLLLLFFIVYWRQKLWMDQLEARLHTLAADPVRRIIAATLNMTYLKPSLEGSGAGEERSGKVVPFPSLDSILPHLRGLLHSPSLDPLFVLPNRRLPRVRVVIGMPTIQRASNVSYLNETLRMFVDRADPQYLNWTRIVVMISHENGTSSPWVQETLVNLKTQFDNEIESGFIQVIGLPPSFLPPDLHSIRPTLGDDHHRMYWRSKQNLDFMYLMAFAAPMGEYYMLMEDDIEPSYRYTSVIFKKLEDPKMATARQLQFTYLGCIGKMMRTVDAPGLILTVAMGWTVKPIDWILEDYYFAQLCYHGMSKEECAQIMKTNRPTIRPAIFQHIGYHSSLEGKIQVAKDKGFRLHPNV